MSNEINFGDLLPPKKDVETFATSDTVVPEFIKRAAYSPDEVMEETIQKDWERLVLGLSDYVLAEQLTEYELRGMGKPVAENYSEYFHDTLKDVKKNRKKSEQKLYKLIPRHSQLEACEFFERVEEQNAKENEARERAMELYPPTGVAKRDTKDDARKGLMKEAAGRCEKCGAELDETATDPLCGTCRGKVNTSEDTGTEKAAAPTWTSPEAQKGSQTNSDAGPCTHCKGDVPPAKGILMANKLFCMKCHDEGHSVPQKSSAPPPMLPAMLKEATCDDHGAPITVEISDVEVKDKGKISVKPNHPETVKDMLDTVDGKKDKEEIDVHLMKEAAAKWKPGQHLYAKYDMAAAYVVYINEDAKTYTIKVDGTMYPSYYAFDDAHDTFDAAKPEDTKDGTWAKSHGLS